MNKKGFTLIEVLVSLSLVSVIAIFLFQIIFIIRDIYVEKSVKSELYIESSNISNLINKEILTKANSGVELSDVRKISSDQAYLTYSDGTSMYINIDRDTNTISYGNYNTHILSSASIGVLDLYQNYEINGLAKNGVFYIKIPITHPSYNNDFSIRIMSRYDSTKTLVTG